MAVPDDLLARVVDLVLAGRITEEDGLQLLASLDMLPADDQLALLETVERLTQAPPEERPADDALALLGLLLLLRVLQRGRREGWLPRKTAQDLAQRAAQPGFRIRPSQLPLPPRDAIPQQPVGALAVATARQQIAQALAADVQDLDGRLGRLSQGRAALLRERLQDAFEADTRRLAQRLASGDIDLATWHRQMQGRVVQHLVAQAMAGARRPLSQAELERLARQALRQAGFLARWADQIAVRQLQGQALRPGGLASRAALYGGAGRGEWFRAFEAGPGLSGYVVDYIARDDNRTCGPCLEAASRGPYLPGQGPMPGQVCLGRARCRCRRQPRFDPAAAAALQGQLAP